jgi:hypothetical protein
VVYAFSGISNLTGPTGVTGAASTVTGPTGATGPINPAAFSASNITVTATATNANFFPAFVQATSGNIGIRADSDFTYNPSTNQLTAGAFIPASATAPTNGMYLVTTNTLGFATNSAEEMRIASDGNVAIGSTSTSNGMLTVQMAAGVNTAGTLYLTNGTYWMRHISQSASGAYNPLVTANDQTLIYSNGTENNGNLVIGQWSSSPRGIKINNTGNVGIGITSPGFNLHVGGQVGATGEITAFASDARLKTNIQVISDSLKKLRSIKGVTFDWDSNVVINGFSPTLIHDVGVLAQDIQRVLPEAIRPAPFDVDSSGVSRSGQNYLTVQYEKLTALLIEAVKEQQATIDAHESRLHRLERMLNIGDNHGL